MATISVINPHERDLHASRSTNVKVPYLVERQFSIKELVALKGSALAPGDVVTALKVPANSVVVLATIGVKSKLKTTTLTASVGTTATPKAYIDAANLVALNADQVAVGVISPAPTTVINISGETVNVVLDTLVGADPDDVIRVNFQIVDVSTAPRPGIAALGS